MNVNLCGQGSACLWAQVNDSYAVLLREKKLPMSLLEDPEKGRAEGAKVTHSLTPSAPALACIEPFHCLNNLLFRPAMRQLNLVMFRSTQVLLKSCSPCMSARCATGGPRWGNGSHAEVADVVLCTMQWLSCMWQQTCPA